MKSSRFVVIGLLAGLGTGWGQGAFAQKIYWTDVLYGRIQKADVGCLLGPNPSGCTVTVLDTLTVVPPTATHPGAKSPNSVTVDSINGRIYWSEFWTGVHRTTLDGQSTQTIVPTPPMPIHASWNPPVFLPGLNRESSELLRADIQGIALDRVKQLLYFGPDHPFESPLGSKYLNPKTDPPFAGGRIRRSNLDGSSRVDLLANAIDGFPGGLGLDLTRNQMYWGNPTSMGYPVSNRLMRANLDGSNPDTFLSLDNVCDPRHVAVDEAAGQVYFTCAFAHAIMRVKVDGSELTLLLSNLGTPEGLTLDVPHGKLYFAEVNGGRVSRANLDGSGYEVLVSEQSFPPGTFTKVNSEGNHVPFAPNGIALDLGGCLVDTSISADFDKTPISGGTTLWFNSSFNASGLPKDTPTKVYFQNARVRFTAGGSAYDLPVPDAVITFSPDAACSSTTFDNNTWRTTLPTRRRGPGIFLAGLAFPVPPGGLPRSIKGVTWSGTFRTDTPGLSINWHWSAAAYSKFPNPIPDPEAAYNAIGVKSTHVFACAYDHPDHAGTPENFKRFLVDGPRGGEGAKWTGKPSETAEIQPICSIP